MPLQNIFYAQSGGPTAVINASAYGLIKAAQQHADKIGRVYVGKNGIMGALKEELIDVSLETADTIEQLQYMPGSAFGSCRYKLKNIQEDKSEYLRLIEVFKAHNIGYFFYNGGGDSQDTAHKVSTILRELGYPITCIGIPKTIDNDLPFTDTCPGFGSTAKYIATSIAEASMDVAGMAASSTKVFIMEVMGRHAGWIAAAGGLAHRFHGDAPQVILFPEVAFDKEKFKDKVQRSVSQNGYCSIVVSEGVKDSDGRFLSESGTIDAFGHHQLGGVAPIIHRILNQECHLKCHWAVSDYLQRSARHIASQTDFEQALALGRAAIEFALEGKNNVMLTVNRLSAAPYTWDIGTVPLKDVANIEKKMPMDFISEDGFGITDACRDYMLPLIQGEAYPPFKNGLPCYPVLEKHLLKQQCAALTLA